MKIKIPPVILMFIVAFMMWLVEPWSPKIEFNETIRIGLSILIFMTGASFAILGVIEFRKADTSVDPVHIEKAESLVTSGVYRLSRNPMYVGFAMFLLAYAFVCMAPLLLIGVVVYVLYMNKFQISAEEEFMNEKFGEEYRQYKSEVRRWI